jgi:transposase
VTLSQKELQRIHVVENAVSGKLTVREAAELLQLSERQVKRLKQRREPDAGEWIHHGNRGRTPVNAVPEEVRQKVVDLASGKYTGFNDSHLQEKLAAAEGIVLSRPSIRRILRGAHIKSPQKRRAPKYRSRRERRAQEGMMVLTDASRHDWLEGRGPELTMIGWMDDATGKVYSARFQLEHEDSAGYLRTLRHLVETRGIPWSVYRDQHGTFQRNDDHWSVAEQLAGRQMPTQVGRALEELGIESIAARSPQAKGRVERLWKTFQDRLVSELRLAGASTLEQSNGVLELFLADYNQRFARPPKEAVQAWRKLDHRLDLDYIFSLRYERTVGKDHVVSLGEGISIQLPALAGKRGFAGRKVDVCQQPDGRVLVYLDRRLLLEQSAPSDQPVRALKMNRSAAPRKKKPVRIYNLGGRPATRT